MTLQETQKILIIRADAENCAHTTLRYVQSVFLVLYVMRVECLGFMASLGAVNILNMIRAFDGCLGNRRL